MWPGVEDDAGAELRRGELVAQPGQVPGIMTIDGRRSLDLDGDDSAVGPFDHQINLATAAILTQVVHGGRSLSEAELGS